MSLDEQPTVRDEDIVTAAATSAGGPVFAAADADGTDADGTDADGTDADGTDADGTDADGTEGDARDLAGPADRHVGGRDD